MDSWEDFGIILDIRPHGEHGGIVSLMTESHGRHAGFMHGAQSTKRQSDLSLGNLVKANWSCRTEGGLGTYKIENDKSYAAYVMDDPRKLLMLQSMCALTQLTMPENENTPGVFHASCALLESLKVDIWAPTYIYWEMGLLSALGFALDLESCAATGTQEELIYVSPKSARAVSRGAGEIYKDKLLPLPAFLTGAGDFDDQDIADGLQLTSYFLQHRVFGMTSNLALPSVRHRLFQEFNEDSP